MIGCIFLKISLEKKRFKKSKSHVHKHIFIYIHKKTGSHYQSLLYLQFGLLNYHIIF